MDYRFDKKFEGNIVVNNKKYSTDWFINVNYRNLKIKENHINIFHQMKKKNLIKELNLVKVKLFHFMHMIKNTTFKMLEVNQKSLIC